MAAVSAPGLHPRPSPELDAVIIGGGLAGLSVAEYLRAKGRSVCLLEAAPAVGGLVRSIEVGGEPVEAYYHHIFPQDTETIELLERLGLGDRLEWRHGPMAILHQGVVRPLDST
jgi:protoporphyrinogen oxidase